MTRQIDNTIRSSQRWPLTVAWAEPRQGRDTNVSLRVQTLRELITDRVEADIALLDVLDGDPNLEGDGLIYLESLRSRNVPEVTYGDEEFGR